MNPIVAVPTAGTDGIRSVVSFAERKEHGHYNQTVLCSDDY